MRAKGMISLVLLLCCIFFTPVLVAEEPDEELKMIYYLTEKNQQRNIGQWFELNYAGFSNPKTYSGFLTAVKNFNPAEVRAKIDEAIEKWPETFTDTHWVNTELLAFMDDMVANGFSLIGKYAEEMLDQSAEFNQAGNYDKALQALSLADNILDGILLFNNKNSDSLAFKAKVNTEREKVKQSLKKYYTSDFHAQNAGKIVFSKVPLSADGKEGTKVSATFKDNDTIHGMAYLNSRLSDIEKDKLTYLVLYFFDGVAQNSLGSTGNIIPEKFDDTFLQFPILVGPKDTEMNLPASIIQKMAMDLKAGKHVIKIQLTTFGLAYGNEKVLAEGSFEFEIANPDNLKALADAHQKAAIARARIPALVISNPSLESDMKSLMQQNFTEPITALRATIVESSWNIVKDEYNQPMYRYIRGFVAFKVNRTGKVYYRGIAIMQSYEGAGTYSKNSRIYDPTAPYDLYEMELANVNK